MSTIQLIATAAFGLESEVAYELKKLGYEDQHTEPGKVTFKGDFLAIARANLWLRTAERVQIKLGEFPARNFDELYDGVRAIPWSDYLTEDATFPVDGKSVKSLLTSLPAVQRVTKKAIVDHMAARYKRAELPETGPRHMILVSLLNDVATLTLDTTGEGLHKRGYRPVVAAAPLRETLAAGLIQLSRWRPERPFADPLCGSGTIPIEAALIGLNIAPGMFRKFDSEAWGSLPSAIWQEARKEAVDLARRSQRLEIYGSDLNGEVIELARMHARQAGVADRIRFEERPVRELDLPGDYGVIICNPPYGERLGERVEVEQLYTEMGFAFRAHETWSAYILTSYEDFERFYGQKASKKRKLYNGRIKVELFQYHGPRPPRPEKA